ncbi:CBS domain-containing protein [candidate division GN15 bacterium]|nr:CBS domain-containing protein [candidate division GN15 bacterium]
MFGRGIKLFKLFGFEVRIDLSWLILAALITWSLARGLFPQYYTDLPTAAYWWMGIGGMVGLFVSIVLHELAHSIVARQYGIPMHGITLFIFGGIAQMHDEPKSAKAELLMAIAGPIASAVIAVIFLAIDQAVAAGGSTPLRGVLIYLGFLNLVLAGFNMLPAFPLDGGRVLRSVLWVWKDDLRWATRISSKIGSGFGIALIVLGVINFVTGNFIGGVWMFLIGMFLRAISQQAYQQLLIRKSLEGESIERFMRTNPVTVPPSISVRDFVEKYVYEYHFKFFPVVEDSKLVSCVKVDRVKDLDREEWDSKTVRDIATECSTENMTEPGTDPVKVLGRMRKSGNSRMMVTRGSELVGIIALKDMLEFLSLKVDLEES